MSYAEKQSAITARLREMQAHFDTGNCDVAASGCHELWDAVGTAGWALELVARWRKKAEAADGLWGLDEVEAMESLARALGLELDGPRVKHEWAQHGTFGEDLTPVGHCSCGWCPDRETTDRYVWEQHARGLKLDGEGR